LRNQNSKIIHLKLLKIPIKNLGHMKKWGNLFLILSDYKAEEKETSEKREQKDRGKRMGQ